MALPQRYIQKDVYTEAEYFAFESEAFGRWEYVNGEIRAMAGGSDDHNAISANVVTALKIALRAAGNRTCRVYGSDMKAHTGDGVNTFPDASVVCGPRQYHQGRTNIITNPLVLVEVLSDSTEGYDRAEKFDHYQTIPALQDYVLVEQDEPRVLRYTRRDDHWELYEYVGRDADLTLPSLGVTLALSDLYDLIEFPSPENVHHL